MSLFSRSISDVLYLHTLPGSMESLPECKPFEQALDEMLSLQSDIRQTKLSFLDLPPEIRRLVYSFLTKPCWYLLDKSHPKAVHYKGMERLPVYSEPFTIPDWTFELDSKTNSGPAQYMVALRSQLRLSSTCRQLRSEIFEKIMRTYHFSVIWDTVYLSKINRFLRTIGPANRYALRYIKIQSLSYRLMSELPKSPVRHHSTANGSNVRSHALAHYQWLDWLSREIKARCVLELIKAREQSPNASIISLLRKYRLNFRPDLELEILARGPRDSYEMHVWGYGNEGLARGEPCLKRTRKISNMFMANAT